MFDIWKYLRNLLYSYGFWKKNGTLLFLGLDNAGKTTLMYLLKENKFIATLPTGHPTSEEFTLDNLVLKTYDVGGHIQVRKVWQDYFPIANGIVFLLDVANRERFGEARAELNALLELEELANCPMVILANKIDKYNAAGEEEIKDYFKLHALLTGKQELRQQTDKRPLELFMCSLKANEGYGDGIRWLSNFF
jgi:GTP-binding protein SAR1